MENNNTNTNTTIKVVQTTSWIDRAILGTLTTVAAVGIGFNIYTYFADRKVSE